MEQIIESTVQPTELEKRDCHLTLLMPPELQSLLFTFTILWTCPVQNGVDLVEVSIFYYKLEKSSGQTVWPINIKTVALFYLIMAA